MQRYNDVVQDTYGNIVPTASITVNVHNGSQATIYSNNSLASLTQPFTPNSQGQFFFYAADGRYDINVTYGGTTYTLYDVLLEDDSANAYATLAQLSASSGSSLVGWIQSGTGAVAETVQDKLRNDLPSVFDFMTAAQKADVQTNTGSIDVTACFTSAHTASKEFIVPAGTYLIDNYRPASGEVWHCAGYTKTIIKQKDVANPAIYCKSDVTTGQLKGVNLSGFGVIGAGAGTVSVVVVEATTPYVVTRSNFDYITTDVNKSLTITCPTAEVYSNKFKVDSYSSALTAFTTAGAYNRYDLVGVLCADGTTIYDTTINGIFDRAISDGSQVYYGNNCTINCPTVETIYGTAQTGALYFLGNNHTAISPTITNVSSTMATNFGMFIYNSSHVIVNPRIWGTVYPLKPFDVNSAGAASTIIGGSMLCTSKIETYISASNLAKMTLIGDVSTYSIQGAKYKDQILNISTAATYTVDANKAYVGLEHTILSSSAAGCTITLPSGAEYTWRKLKIITYTASAVISASSNVVPQSGASAGTAILAATIGKWAELQYNGTNWYIISSN